MILFCLATYASWALVFQSAPNDTNGLERHATGCYSDEVMCRFAADAANHAFSLDGYEGKRFAKCELNRLQKQK